MTINVDTNFFMWLQSFPPSGHLNAQIYGSQQSAITAEHILKSLDGISVEEVFSSFS